MRFYKGQALGNDYIVVEPSDVSDVELVSLVQIICNRNFGIGSDGILYGPTFENGRPAVRIFNPDGSEAEKSGNGIRIFSKYLYDKKYIKDDTFELVTRGGIVSVTRLSSDARNLEVSMGRLTFNSKEIPVDGIEREMLDELIEIDGIAVMINCASIGNPHCVVFVDGLNKEYLSKGHLRKEYVCELGAKLESHPIFPKRINVQFVHVLDRNNIAIEIWERGAGYTLASGSSSSAAAGVSYRKGLCDNKITVHMPGGQIHIELSENFDVTMTGEVCSVAEGVISQELISSVVV